jgi:glycosyltransferase involved in cell wall biosynthesis
MTLGPEKTRVAVFSPSLEAVSGVSTHVRMLFASDLAEDFELLHFQVGSEGRRETRLRKLLRYTFSPLQLGLFLLRTRTNIVHMNTSLERNAYWRDLAYLAVSKLLRRQVVSQVHGGALPQQFFEGSLLLTNLLRRFLLWSDAVAVLSSTELAAYRAFDARTNVHLIPNAIDPAGLVDQVRSYNTDQAIRLVFVGRLVRSKGVFEIVEALAQLKRGGREFHLSIAGDGSDHDELVAATVQAGLAECVTFLGAVFNADKHRLWLASDLFVFPTYAEGLPYSLLEAMAAGCVPVTTPVAAIPDVMQDCEHGLLVPVRNAEALASAVAALDDDRQKMVRMAEAARRRIAEHYTVKRLADDFRRLYQSLVKLCAA